MKHLLLFRKGPIDRASTVEDSAGETVDFLAVPFDNLVNISATYGEVILYIREANGFENSKANLAQVTLSVEPTREIETVKQLWATIRQDNPTGYIEFNSPIRKFPIESIREIKSIKRFTTERFGDGGGISNVVEDTTPQLGGNLDVNGNKIVSTSNGNIDIEPNGTGDVLLGNFKFDADQSVGSGQDNYLLTYDHSSGKISLEAAAGGNEYIQYNGSANNTNAGQDRYIPLGGNYVDTSSIQVYSKAMVPFAGVVESITVRTDNASGSTTTKLLVNGSVVNSSTDTLSANTPLTIAFGDSVSAGDLIACTMNTTNSAGDSYVTVLIKKS